MKNMDQANNSKKKNVAIYTTPSCVYCRMTKEFFKKNRIEYKELNVATDLKAREEMIHLSGQLGVPVIAIGNDIVIGFDQPKLTELLELKPAGKT